MIEAELSSDKLLALHPALGSLTQNEIAALCLPAAVANLAEGTELFAERQACRGFPLLISGTIKVVKTTPAGREMLLYRVEPGGSCVITSSCLLGHTPYTARGIAETPLQMLILPTALFETLIAGKARFRDFVFPLLADRIAELMQLSSRKSPSTASISGWPNCCSASPSLFRPHTRRWPTNWAASGKSSVACSRALPSRVS